MGKCIIYLVDLKRLEERVRLPCANKFRANCLREGQKTTAPNPTCPVCRFNLKNMCISYRIIKNKK